MELTGWPLHAAILVIGVAVVAVGFYQMYQAVKVVQIMGAFSSKRFRFGLGFRFAIGVAGLALAAMGALALFSEMQYPPYFLHSNRNAEGAIILGLGVAAAMFYRRKRPSVDNKLERLTREVDS